MFSEKVLDDLLHFVKFSKDALPFIAVELGHMIRSRTVN
jgi:hypothetical protein